MSSSHHFSVGTIGAGTLAQAIAGHVVAAATTSSSATAADRSRSQRLWAGSARMHPRARSLRRRGPIS
jgi:hypothetical protein